MSLVLEKLEAVEEQPGGGWQARCPACAEMEKDTACDNLRIWPSEAEDGQPGKYTCWAFQGDAGIDHRKRIFLLAGSRSKKRVRPRIPSKAELEKKAREKSLQKAVLDGAMARDEARSFQWDWSAESGPLPRGQRENWLAFLALWNPTDRIWVGGQQDSDRVWGSAAELRERYPDRPPAEADLTRLVIWPETASLRRTIQVTGRKYLVVECDQGDREEQMRLLGFIRSRLGLGLTLRAVVDSTGKSRHGWFDVPAIQPMSLALICAFLKGLGADGNAIDQSATRVPGAYRQPDPRKPEKPSGGLQTIVWIDPTTNLSH